MGKTILWNSSSSVMLYSYQYAFCIVIGLVLYQFDPRLILLSVGIVLILGLDALTMKYELTKNDIYISSSLLDREDATVELKDIVGLALLQPFFFKFFNLGTVLLVTDFESQYQPCIKCIKNPKKLERMIKRQAISCGAELAYG